MITKFNSNNQLSVDRPIEVPRKIIVVTAIFLEKNKNWKGFLLIIYYKNGK